MRTEIFVGLDVAKAQVDVAVRPSGEQWGVANDEAGVAQLVERLAILQPTLVVAEATGGFERAAIAALVGVAPLARDSGPLCRKRMVWGGRASVRTAMYMAALVGRRWNPHLRSFYERLRAAGKPQKVALIACARKLLTILNAMVRDNACWASPEPRLQHSC